MMRAVGSEYWCQRSPSECMQLRVCDRGRSLNFDCFRPWVNHEG
jgi:hypothetical protein